MMALTPALPPLEDESLFSWVARLADFHANQNCANWLRFMEISQQSIINHDEVCLDRLADLTGFSKSRIEDCGITHVGDRSFRHRREPFGAFFARLTQTSYCPACLLDDTATGGPSAGHRVGRTSWVFNPVRTCPKHRILLSRRANSGYHERFQDMTRVAPEDSDLEHEVSERAERSVSSMQRYIQARFTHGPGSGWLDRQRIDQAAKTCEFLGACHLFGAHTNLDALTLAQWDEAGAVGFEAARTGEDGIRRMLEEIAAQTRLGRKIGGPQALYGRLYQWIQFNKTKTDPGPIRDVLRAHILDTMAIAPGTTLLGEDVTHRRRHSITSLAKKTGLHSKTIRYALSILGHLPKEQEEQPDDWTNFDAQLGEDLVARVQNSIQIFKLPEYLKCNRTQAEALVKQGFIPALFPGVAKHHMGIFKKIATKDLDTFLTRFRAAGLAVTRASEGMMDVIGASEAARRPVMDIVRLVLDGRLSRVELLSEELGFRSVLVDPNDVRAAMKGLERERGLSPHDVGRRLGIASYGATHLRINLDRDGRPFLAAEEIVNVKGTIRYQYPESEVARFQADHITLKDLASERGLSTKAMSAYLSDRDIKPILDRKLLLAAIYRRADL